MCCFFLVLVFLGPRASILVWWLANPARWDEAFDGFLWPLLGFIFLPVTLLMYVIVRPAGVSGIDYLWLGLAVLADVAMYSGGVYKRDQVPGYSNYATS